VNAVEIAVLGAGYVGLVSASCFADFGHNVTCIDVDQSKISAILAGRMPFFEPGLSDLVERNLKAKRLSFTAKLDQRLGLAALVFIAVGTPERRGDGHADLSFVYDVARSIAAFISKDAVVVTKSTVPVGTGDEVERIIRSSRPGDPISIASNPEFLREGAAIEDFKRPNRIVIGVEDKHAERVLNEAYRPLHLNHSPMMVTSRRAAELIKYAANAFLATKITFINEIADLCEQLDVDVQDVSRGIGLDARIGPKFLHAGPGYGGSCFPKDTRALIRSALDHGVTLRIVEAVDGVNSMRKRAMARKISTAVGGNLRKKKIGILGLTFKPNTDDIRESPSIDIITALQDLGAEVQAFDPEGIESSRRLMPGVTYVETPEACAEGVDALVIVTEWEAFRALDFTRLKRIMKSPIVVDLRNIYRPEDMRDLGFRYVSIGRQPVG
jgi:UDPglucose 6-dehydrogenase